MSEEKKEETKSEEKSFLGIPAGTLLTTGASLITGILGAGPWGIIGVALGTIGAIFGINKLIGHINGKIDKADMDRAGADSGNTAVDLVNQIDQNKKAIDKERELNPPTKGFKKE